jgi:hypothetical protein
MGAATVTVVIDRAGYPMSDRLGLGIAQAYIICAHINKSDIVGIEAGGVIKVLYDAHDSPDLFGLDLAQAEVLDLAQ